MIHFGWFRQGSERISGEKIPRASPDAHLIQRIATRDREALAELYTRFQHPLFRYLFHLLGQKELAEDLLQEVMVIVWQKAHTFQRRSPVSSWIFGIAHHQAFKALRDQHPERSLDEEGIDQYPDEQLDLEAHILRQSTRGAIEQALRALTPEHREVLELAFFQDFSGKEIASIVGIPVGTVKSRLSYARKALKQALLRDGWEAQV